MRRAALIAGFIIFLMSFGAAFAQNPEAIPDLPDPGGNVPLIQPRKPWSINVWGRTYHFDREAVREKNYNEDNWGLGLRRELDWGPNGLFAEANVLRNSTRGLTTTAGTGIMWPVAKIDDYTLSLGASAFLITYRNEQRGKTLYGIGYAPGIAIGKNDWSLNVVFIPKNSKRLGEFGAATLFLNFRLDF